MECHLVPDNKLDKSYRNLANANVPKPSQGIKILSDVLHFDNGLTKFFLQYI